MHLATDKCPCCGQNPCRVAQHAVTLRKREAEAKAAHRAAQPRSEGRKNP